MAQRRGSQEIIAFCLEPLDLRDRSQAVWETERRMADMFRSLQGTMATACIASIDPDKAPVVINETAHGYDM